MTDTHRTEDQRVDDGAAFPVVIPFEGGVQYFGLSKRELFAAMAMQGLLAGCASNYDAVAEGAVRQADALLKELAK